MEKLQNREIIKHYLNCLKAYGLFAQMDVAIEELSECIKAICKVKRLSRTVKGMVNQQAADDRTKKQNRAYEELAGEIADVRIMLEQLELFLHLTDECEKQYQDKIRRQMERLENGK